MLHRACSALMLVFLFAGPLAAQNNGVNEQSFFNGYSLGRGARAAGMGGAEIAMPGPAGPTSANPAELARVAGIAVAFSFGIDDLRQQPTAVSRTAPAPPYTATSTVTEHASGTSGRALDFLAVAYRVPYKPAGRVVVVQLSYDRAIPFSRNLDYAYAFQQQSSYRFDYDYTLAIEGSGGIDAVTFSAASEVVKGLFVGASLHRWFSGYMQRTRETYQYSTVDYYGFTGRWTDETTDTLRFDLSGYSVDLGVQYVPTPWLMAGFVVRSGGSLGVDYSSAPTYTNGLANERFSSSGSGHGTLAMPASIGMGVGFRYKRATIGLDHVRTRWSSATLGGYARANANGGTVTPGTYAYPSMKTAGLGYQLDAGQTHLGGEYSLTLGPLELPVRAGFFLQDRFVTNAVGDLPMTRGITAGAGLVWRRVGVDAAWMRYETSGELVRDSFRVSLRCAF